MPTPQPTQPVKDDDGLVTHVHTETPAQVTEYWTPERMQEARPVPMPSVVVPPTIPPTTPAVGKKPTKS